MNHSATVVGVPTLKHEVRVQTNPDYPQCTQPVPLVVGKTQIQTYLVEARRAALAEDNTKNDAAEENAGGQRAGGKQRLGSEETFLKTVDYVKTTLRSAIYVLIVRGQIKLFVPFTMGNEFRNTWGGQISVEPHYHIEGLSDPHQWWANATILCTRPSPDFWGSSFVAAYRHMLQEAVSEHDTVEFMLNKRDHPAVRLDGSHPWHHVWSDTPPTVVAGPLLPFLSSYTGPECADIPLPLAFPDWERATQLVFPGDNHRYPPSTRIRVQWQDKLDVAFFRGSNTGNGVRTALCRYNGSRLYGIQLDLGITRYSRRFKIQHGTVQSPEFPSAAQSRFVPMKKQGQYKYLVCVDGHSAPNRVATLYLTGSLVVRVASDGAATPGRQLWGDDRFLPGEHFIPVAADLSDFGSKLQWMATHPSECEAIAQRGLALATALFSKEGMVAGVRRALQRARVDTGVNPK